VGEETVLPPTTADIDGYRVTIYPPHRSQLAENRDEIPLVEQARLLAPTETPTLPAIRMDGDQVLESDVIQIDFVADSFDRRIDESPDDPPIEFVFRILNGFLRRFRTVGRAFQLQSLNPQRTTWRIQYLNDDGTPLEPEEGLFRGRGTGRMSYRLVGLPLHTWQRIHELPLEYAPPPADDLLLDAFGLLPHVGAAVVLGFAALETQIESVLDQLALAHDVGSELWAWINDRNDYRKAPSTGEQFDSLLRAVTGDSLKDRPPLWEAFANLRAARNTFVHDGEAVLGGSPVSSDRALELLQRAGDVMDWVEGLVPEADRRPRDEQLTEFEITSQLSVATDDSRDPRDDEQVDNSG
jgi:hypothetical protein